ncbi:MAG TPA: hypothetical protein VF195_03345 [Actinomycetota bacterium]
MRIGDRIHGRWTHDGVGDRPPDVPLRSESRAWAQLGFACGVLAMVAYTILSAVPLSPQLQAVAVSIFGPGIAVASAGLYEVLRLHRSTVGLRIALVANIAAASTVTMMLFGQIAFKRWLELEFPTGPVATSSSPAYQAANGLQLGFDVVWDLFFAIGTLLFALAMWTHPRFGRGFAITGGVLAVLLLTLNLGTFPEPPEKAGLVDVGPLVGLWYLAAAVRMRSSLRWVDRMASGSAPPVPKD